MLKQQFSQLRSQREQFEYAFHGLLTGFINRLEQGNPQLSGASQRQELGSGRQPEPEDVHTTAAERFIPGGDGADDGQEHEDQHNAEDTATTSRPQPLPDPAAGVERSADTDEFSAAIAGAEAARVEWPEAVPDAAADSSGVEGSDIITALINRQAEQAAAPQINGEHSGPGLRVDVDGEENLPEDCETDPPGGL